MMGPKGASSIKVPSAWWHSSRSGGLLLLFFFAMNSFHLCQNYVPFIILDGTNNKLQGGFNSGNVCN